MYECLFCLLSFFRSASITSCETWETSRLGNFHQQLQRSFLFFIVIIIIIIIMDANNAKSDQLAIIFLIFTYSANDLIILPGIV